MGFLGNAAATVIVDDTFADGQRGPTGNQNLPSSMNWYASNAASLTATTGNMTLTPGASALAYYTSTGTINLLDGQKMTMTIAFTPTFTTAPTSDNLIRFALFNSNGSRVTADGGGTSPSSGVYAPYTGYMGGIGNGLSLYERTSGSNNLINSIGSGGYTSLTSGASLSLVSGTQYVYTLSLERSGTSTILTAALTGGTLSGRTITYADTTGAYSSFDSVALYQGSGMPQMDFTEVKITTVPEPSVLALSALACVAFLGMHRRASARRSA
ncbi:hypothetical protein DB345_01725 [Spartobacteria bacterium LR76]|nr:hypothetical protein DB345_01725 [Spartobacteria bacterium LR76]